jgi:hypothetical protein
VNNTKRIGQQWKQADGAPELPDGFTVQPDTSVHRASSRAEPLDGLTKKTQMSNWTVLAMLVLCFFVIIRFRPFAAPNPGQGKTLARLQLQPLTGEGPAVRLADLTGRVVLISFWETGSSQSRNALPHFAALERQFRGWPAFRFLAVACARRAKEDYGSLRRDTRALLEEKHLDVLTYADLGGVSRSAVEQAVGLSGYPTTLILDRAGRIRGRWTGYQPGAESEMRQLISRLLSER